MENSLLTNKVLRKRVSLTIDEKVLLNAKLTGIKNISGFTESMLRAFTISGEKNTKDERISATKSFFKTIQPFLQKYDCSIRVGYLPEKNEISTADAVIILYADQLKIEYEKRKLTTSVDQIYSYLDPFENIVEELISTLIRSSQKNEEKIKELQLASKLLKTLFDNEGDNH